MIEREIRQFRQLLRLSYNRLLEAALSSREIDAVQFVIWGGALMSTFPFFYAIGVTSAYPYKLSRLPFPQFQIEVLQDRLFFVTWAMITAMLLVSLIWDAVFPDRTDQQILGVLPVRSRTVAAARLSATLMTSIAFISSTSVLGATLYALTAAVHPSLGSRAAILAGHLLAAVMAGLFTTCALLTVRAVIVLAAGAVAAARVALVLQVVTVILLFETFMFLPGLLPGIVQQIIKDPSGPSAWAPPAWFLGTYVSIAGPDVANLGGLSRIAGIATMAAFITAWAMYLIPATWNARRAIEARLPGGSNAWTAGLLGTLDVVRPSPAARVTFGFVLQSLTRNKQQLQTVAIYVGLAVAAAGTRLLSAAASGSPWSFDRPTDYLLAIPLVITFVLVLGLRAAFANPTEPAANWIFRLVSTRAPAPCIAATRAAVIALAVLPASGLTLLFGLWRWAPSEALSVALMHAASGVALTEIAMLGARAIPFTRAHAPSTAALKVGWYAALVALHLYAFRLDDVQLAALGLPLVGPLLYVGGAIGAAALVRTAGRWWFTETDLLFDAPSDTLTVLNLSRS